MNKKERLVAAIEHGTVIDHIPANKTYQVASLLGLFDLKTPVTIGFNQRYHQGVGQILHRRRDLSSLRSSPQCHSEHHPRL